jgi:CubicO group peptidase (beta-lactamase class C family)
MTDVHGHVAAGFEAVGDAYAAAFEGRPLMGAALAVRHRGELVVDLWGGIADDRDGSPWERDTASVVFSCTKGLMAILAARLVEEGRLDYDAPVAEYWPEFAQAGKSGVLVRHVLAHQSGLSAPRRPWTLTDALDWTRATTALAAQEPLWEPGAGHAYHALTHGWLVGERRARRPSAPGAVVRPPGPGRCPGALDRAGTHTWWRIPARARRTG